MKKFIVFFALILALTGYVYATDSSFNKAFNDLDTNKDGKLDMKELDTAAMKIFKKYDKNSDGILDKSEFKAIKDAKSRFEDLDTNKDGKLDMKELRDAASKKFKLYDRNQDGALDELECNPHRSPNVNPLFLIYF
jgi:hypothetical protein